MIIRFAIARASPSLLMLWVLATTVSPRLAADDPTPEPKGLKREREARLEKMRALAGQFDVTSAAADETTRFDLRGEPLFRYSDQPRGFVDATLWAWGP